ncbi:MAG: DUF4160 domain-containing protein [Phycisphaerae bacterium]|nr:DUF4160 domain-containing protein [Phycisphaerae bacterium]
MHVHVYCAGGEAKFWLSPTVRLAQNCKLSKKQIAEVKKIIQERQDDIKGAWKKHFRS